MNNRENTFQYTYSGKERSEVETIRQKYLPQEESKLDRLRKLDRSATRKAEGWAIAQGVIGTLILGTGMSLRMTDLSVFLGDGAMFAGIPLGLLGLILVALAYPVYNRVLKKERRRIAPEILRLTDELMT